MTPVRLESFYIHRLCHDGYVPFCDCQGVGLVVPFGNLTLIDYSIP